MASCGVDMPKETKSSFETMTVEKQNITVPVKFSAKLKGQSDVAISPQVSGQLMQICVSEGQQVKKGTTLFVIDSRNAQLELEAAQANLTAVEASANSAKLEYESNKNLFAKNIVSRYMLDNSENSYKQAQAAVGQARAAVSRAQVNLGFCTITSPVDGIIGEIPVTEGIQVSIACKATFPNPDGLLYSGIQGTIVLPAENKDVMVIPQKAVVRLQDKSIVYKVKSDNAATAVGDVMSLGNTYALRIWLKPDVMAQYGLEPNDVFAAIGEQSFVAATGSLGEQSENAYQYSMEYRGTLKTVEEFNDIVLRTSDGGHTPPPSTVSTRRR